MVITVADVSGLLKGIPPGAWVAISEKTNSVLAYGPDAQEVFREAKEKNENQPLLVRVPERLSAMF